MEFFMLIPKSHVRFYWRETISIQKFQNSKLFFIDFPTRDGKIDFHLEE